MLVVGGVITQHANTLMLTIKLSIHRKVRSKVRLKLGDSQSTQGRLDAYQLGQVGGNIILDAKPDSNSNQEEWLWTPNGPRLYSML